MTLRDCTLFVQVPRELITDYASEQTSTLEESSPTTNALYRNHKLNSTLPSDQPTRRIRIVIADLDEKSKEIRGEYWNSLEAELIAGGYYLGTGKLDTHAENCDLDDVVWTSDQVKWNGNAL